eukprot:scaffold57_cov254-Pinguiococcus_pyrenoidosus.AAC.49
MSGAAALAIIAIPINSGCGSAHLPLLTASIASFRVRSSSISSSTSRCHELPASASFRKDVALTYAKRRHPCVPSSKSRAVDGSTVESLMLEASASSCAK